VLVEVKVPTVGESITEGILSRWLKADGAAVKAGESLFEIETDKVNTEVPADVAGVLRHKAAQGETVKIGGIVATIDTEAAVPAGAAAAVAPPAAGSRGEEAKGASISPLAKRIAEDTKADLTGVQGSGSGGRIMKQDVLAATAKPAPASAPAPVAAAPAVAPAAPRNAERETRKPMSMLRRRIAERLLESQRTTATLTTFNEVDMSAIMAVRNRYKDAFKEKHQVGLGFMSFFVKAVIEGLKAFPSVNGRIDGSDLVHNNFYDVGVAVSTERGLVVPVIRDADKLSFAEIEKKIGDLGKRGREGKLAIEELQGGTFTISNGGVFGSLLSTPILNPPQSGILGMHKIEDRPIAQNGQVVIKPMMYVALSYDHRVIDGRESVSFLVRVKECLENPERMLLDI